MKLNGRHHKAGGASYSIPRDSVKSGNEAFRVLISYREHKKHRASALEAVIAADGQCKKPLNVPDRPEPMLFIDHVVFARICCRYPQERINYHRVI